MSTKWTNGANIIKNRFINNLLILICKTAKAIFRKSVFFLDNFPIKSAKTVKFRIFLYGKKTAPPEILPMFNLKFVLRLNYIVISIKYIFGTDAAL